MTEPTVIERRWALVLAKSCGKCIHFKALTRAAEATPGKGERRCRRDYPTCRAGRPLGQALLFEAFQEKHQ